MLTLFCVVFFKGAIIIYPNFSVAGQTPWNGLLVALHLMPVGHYSISLWPSVHIV